MKSIITFINRYKNHKSHKVFPTNSFAAPNKSKSKDSAGTCLIYLFAYIVCHCIFCPVCFLIWMPAINIIKSHIEPYPTPSPTPYPILSPTSYPSHVQSTLHNVTI